MSYRLDEPSDIDHAPDAREEDERIREDRDQGWPYEGVCSLCAASMFLIDVSVDGVACYRCRRCDAVSLIAPRRQRMMEPEPA